MPYGYSPATHTPEGYVRSAPNPTPRLADAEMRSEHLRRVLHGYEPATYTERRAAFEEMQAAGLKV